MADVDREWLSTIATLDSFCGRRRDDNARTLRLRETRQSSREGNTSLARASRALPSKLNAHVLRCMNSQGTGVSQLAKPQRAVEKPSIVPSGPTDGPMHDHDPGQRWLRSISRDFTHR